MSVGYSIISWLRRIEWTSPLGQPARQLKPWLNTRPWYLKLDKNKRNSSSRMEFRRLQSEKAHHNYRTTSATAEWEWELSHTVTVRDHGQLCEATPATRARSGGTDSHCAMLISLSISKTNKQNKQKIWMPIVQPSRRRLFPQQSAGLWLLVLWQRDNLSNLVLPPSRSAPRWLAEAWGSEPPTVTSTWRRRRRSRWNHTRVSVLVSVYVCLGWWEEEPPSHHHTSFASVGDMDILCTFENLETFTTGRDGTDGWLGFE